MLRINNMTDKILNITDSITVNPKSYRDVNMSINSRLYQMINMGIITVQELSENNNKKTSAFVSEGAMRRQQMLDKIRKGDIKPGVSLDISSCTQLDSNKTKQRKNKKVNK